MSEGVWAPARDGAAVVYVPRRQEAETVVTCIEKDRSRQIKKEVAEQPRTGINLKRQDDTNTNING